MISKEILETVVKELGLPDDVRTMFGITTDYRGNQILRATFYTNVQVPLVGSKEDAITEWNERAEQAIADLQTSHEIITSVLNALPEDSLRG